MIWARLLWPFARDYRDHVGSTAADEPLRAELERRLALLPPWGRSLCCAGAWLLRWALPALLNGRLDGWRGLDDDEREEILSRALGLGAWPLRAALLACRAVVLESLHACEAS